MERVETTGRDGRIRIEFGPITVKTTKPGINPQKWSAELHQAVKKIYPAANTHDSMTDPLFSEEEFNLREGNTYVEDRVGFIDVPVGTTVEQVAAKLAAEASDGRLVKHMALEPILTVEQQAAIQQGLNGITLEQI